jgi:hypothetical protein
MDHRFGLAAEITVPGGITRENMGPGPARRRPCDDWIELNGPRRHTLRCGRLHSPHAELPALTLAKCDIEALRRHAEPHQSASDLGRTHLVGGGLNGRSGQHHS